MLIALSHPINAKVYRGEAHELPHYGLKYKELYLFLLGAYGMFFIVQREKPKGQALKLSNAKV